MKKMIYTIAEFALLMILTGYLILSTALGLAGRNTNKSVELLPAESLSLNVQSASASLAVSAGTGNQLLRSDQQK